HLLRNLLGVRPAHAGIAGSGAARALSRQCGPHLPDGTTMKFKIGYVGVGLMGGPMVKRLSSLGWQVRGYDIVPERSGVRSVAEAAHGADVVVLNLPTNEAVEDVLAKLLPV